MLSSAAAVFLCFQIDPLWLRDELMLKEHKFLHSVRFGSLQLQFKDGGGDQWEEVPLLVQKR